MCYLGTHDTYTPAHKDLCGSVGHNIMVDTESQGSAFWFMTKTSDANAAAQYLQSLGYELDHENHALTLNQISRAPFEVYIGQQQKGDMILVPPSSMHQVVNQGGITLKVSWSRMTPRSLEIAIQQELDIYRR
jgi:JmjC domain, hydroxylase